MTDIKSAAAKVVSAWEDPENWEHDIVGAMEDPISTLRAALTPPPPSSPPSRFAIRNMSVLAYANGFTLWHYKAGKGTLDDVMAPNFFMDASDMASINDIIMVTASDGARIVVVTHADVQQCNVSVLS